MSIRLIDLTKRFGQNVVVNRVSMEVAEGELFTLLGASGSGKSTILRLIAGLVHADAGRIELNERDVTHLPPQERGTGFVFQNYSIFRHMTVAENVEFGLRIRHVRAADRRQRRDELLDLVGLVGLEDRYANQLSGGQQQRVALARALAYRPEVLLLDEPFGALDVKIRAQLRRTLKEIQRHLKVTTILVTHDQEEAFELADHIGVVDRGHLMEVGTAEDLYHHPQTEFVATFVGGGNVLSGREEDGSIRLGRVVLPMQEGAPKHDADAPVRVLFRPEKVVLEGQSTSTGPGKYSLGSGRVVGQVFAGPLSRVVLEVEGLEGARPLSPRPGYGQRTTHIEALVPSDASFISSLQPGQALSIGLSDYHVLYPPGLKVLTCLDQSPGPQPEVEFGVLLARNSGGSNTLLTVVSTETDAAAARESLEALRQKWSASLPRLDGRVRQGDSTTEILLEAQDGLYEVVVIGRRSSGDGAVNGLGTTARRLLTLTGVPVLVLQAPRPSIDRMLICTAAGEPGKTDVRFGGRVARRMTARTTVLHVRPGTAGSDEHARAERHLGQAKRYLTSLGVHSEVSIADGPLVGTILAEAERGDYDLVVIGAPAPRAAQRLRWHDFATEIVSRIRRPVLIVPMQD